MPDRELMAHSNFGDNLHGDNLHPEMPGAHVNDALNSQFGGEGGGGGGGSNAMQIVDH